MIMGTTVFMETIMITKTMTKTTPLRNNINLVIKKPLGENCHESLIGEQHWTMLAVLVREQYYVVESVLLDITVDDCSSIMAHKFC